MVLLGARRTALPPSNLALMLLFILFLKLCHAQEGAQHTSCEAQPQTPDFSHLNLASATDSLDLLGQDPSSQPQTSASVKGG